MSQGAEDSPPVKPHVEEEEEKEYDPADKTGLAGAFGFEDLEERAEEPCEGGASHEAEHEPEDVAA